MSGMGPRLLAATTYRSSWRVPGGGSGRLQGGGTIVSLRVVGAGLGRTGTNSLKLALERLLGAPCYHMFEVFSHPEHLDEWQRAAEGDMPDWHQLFDGFAAGVDWPMASFWPEIADAFPEAI